MTQELESNQLQAAPGFDALKSEYMGTIEVVVLRCEAKTRLKAPDPSVSERHPLAFQLPVDPSARDLASFNLSHRNRPNPPAGNFSDLGALFDGGTLADESHAGAMPFGGDAGWDDNDAGNGWDGGYQSGHQRKNTSKQQDGGSQAPSGGSTAPSNAAPTIVINVNHGNGPPVGGSPAGSWGSSIAPAVQSSGMRPSGQGSGGQGQQNWQSWIQGGQGNGGDNQPASGSSGLKNNEQNRSGWNNDNIDNDNTGWENKGGDTSNWQNDNQNNTGWNDNNANQQDTGWGNDDNGGNDYTNTGNSNQGQSGWDSGNNEGNNWDSGNNDNNNGGWDNDQNNTAQQTHWGNKGNDNTGGWHSNQNNDQGGNDDGWANQNQGNWGNQDTSGNTWGNADAGANETKPSDGQDWNTSGNDEGGWNQADNVNNAAPSIAGGVDPSRFGYSGPSVGKGKSVRSVPGTFPEGPHHTAGFSGPSVSSKPYHVVFDAAGNPVAPQYPVPSPPPPPPIEPVANSKHVQRGQPALYHHKIASPKYLDTHAKPYAVFVFKYRTRGKSSTSTPCFCRLLIMKQRPLNGYSTSRSRCRKTCRKPHWRISRKRSSSSKSSNQRCADLSFRT